MRLISLFILYHFLSLFLIVHPIYAKTPLAADYTPPTGSVTGEDSLGIVRGEVISIKGNQITIRDFETGKEKTMQAYSPSVFSFVGPGDRVLINFSEDNRGVLGVKKE